MLHATPSAPAAHHQSRSLGLQQPTRQWHGRGGDLRVQINVAQPMDVPDGELAPYVLVVANVWQQGENGAPERLVQVAARQNGEKKAPWEDALFCFWRKRSPPESNF